jgi:hypothetical protein
MTLFSFGLSNAPVFEHALLTQLALVASWVSARDVPGLRKLIAYRAARPILWIMTHLLLGRIRKSPGVGVWALAVEPLTPCS